VFFLGSKIIGALLVPSSFIAALGVAGLILIWTRFRRIGGKLLAGCVTALLVCGYLPIGTLLLVPLETRFPPWNAENGEPVGIIVLGGGVDPELSLVHGVPALGPGGARIVVAAALAHQYPRARLVYAGGDGDLLQKETKEADAAAAIFASLGIAHDRLRLERQSRNTEENIRFSKPLADPKPGERWLLVTSAFHMPRSMGIFRKVGFAVEPYPVDWKTRGWPDLLAMQSDLLIGLSLTNIAVHEWIGLAAYRLTGKIDQLFPDPNDAEQISQYRRMMRSESALSRN
jgi:uncharacterized SAM-binding protein YcdF (DUF218 family)